MVNPSLEENSSRLIFQIHFNWPKEQTQEMYNNARKIYDLAMAADWIKDVRGASGAIGSPTSSFWMFTITSYGDLDRIFLDRENEFSKTYIAFISEMRMWWNISTTKFDLSEYQIWYCLFAIEKTYSSI